MLARKRPLTHGSAFYSVVCWSLSVAGRLPMRRDILAMMNNLSMPVKVCICGRLRRWTLSQAFGVRPRDCSYEQIRSSGLFCAFQIVWALSKVQMCTQALAGVRCEGVVNQTCHVEDLLT